MTVTAAAGESWHGLVRFTIGQGLSGLENLALIPGSVGAAPMQNIGAYGVELSDRFDRLRALDVATGAITVFDRNECGFAYRDSRFKSSYAGRFIVLEVTLRLSRETQPVLEHPELKLELERLGRAGFACTDCRSGGARAPAETARSALGRKRRQLL